MEHETSKHDRMALLRTQRIERKLDAIIAHLGIQLPPEPNPNCREEVEKQLRENNRINAVKVYHSATRCTLIEARDAVDEIALRMKL